MDWNFFVTLNEQMRPLTDALQLQELAVRALGEHLRASRVNYSRVDQDQFHVMRSYCHGVPPLKSPGPRTMWGKAILAACTNGETVAVNDVLTDQRLSESEREGLIAHQVGAFVGAPLIKDGRWLATFAVQSASPRAWTREEIALIEITGQRVWGLSERARLEEVLGQTADRQQFLQRLNDIIRPLADPNTILHETCRLLGIHFRANRVCYAHIDGDEVTIVTEYLDDLSPIPRQFRWQDMVGSRTDTILKTGSLVSNDTSATHDVAEAAELHAAGIGSYNCPLLIKDGRFIGAFGIHTRFPRAWTPDEISLAAEVADRIWATLEHRKAERGLRANEERLAFLLRLNDALRPLSDAALVQTTASKLLSEHLGCTRAGYAETDGHDYVIRHEHARGVAPLTGPSPGINVGTTMREALARGETLVVANVDTDPRLSEAERATMRARQIEAFIGVALFRHGRMVAVFGANHHAPRSWTPAEAELVRDVAERTWDAVERTRAEQALRQQKQRLQLALEASAGGSWTWDAASNKVDWDPRFRELYGFSVDEPASSDKWIPRVHQDDRPMLLADLGELMTSSTRTSWQNTFRLATTDGPVRWIQSRGHVERDADGKIVRLSGLDLDFTKHRLAEQAVQALRDQEHNQALQARTDELEYRTTQLSKMASDLILAEQRAREQIARTLHDGLQQLLVIVAVNLERQIKRDAERSGGASEQLFEAQRNLDEAIAAARSLNIELFPPVLSRSGLPAALTWLAGWARDKYKLDVNTRIDPLADSARKDVRTLLFESVRELILNAVKHAKANRLMLELSLDAADQLCITVTDQGAGFDLATWNARSKASQAGWGLFSIRERLTLLGGQVTIDSAPGRGTRVCLTAPRGAAPDLDTSATLSSVAVDPPGSARKEESASDALRILIVDDHPTMRMAIRDMLAELRELTVVGEAANGVEGIAQAHTLRPDVILMDVAMPHMDGVEATRRIHAELPVITILGLSTHSRTESAEAMERAGATEFFVKGLDTGRLIDHLVKEAARRRAGTRAS